MTEQEILKYCHFYKGEAMIPQSLDQYLPKLIRHGMRVAICDQLEDPKTAQKLAPIPIIRQ